MAARAGAGAGEEGVGRDIWAILEAQNGTNDAGGEEGKDDAVAVKAVGDGEECFVLVVGSKQAGKTTLVTQFLNPTKEDTPKPTVALEYTYGRRSNTATNAKDIAHIWELGGGTLLSDLINVPITPQRLPTNVVVIALDLSRPDTVIDTALQWLTLVKARVSECADKVKKSSPGVFTSLVEKAAEAVKHLEHPDSGLITPTVVPIVIVGTKYDLFQDLDSTKRKALLQAVRYLALCHGASFICVSQRDKTQMNQFRSLLNHFVFNTELKRAAQLNPAKPLVIPPGGDTMELIGLPPGASRSDLEVGSLQARVAKYKRVCDEMFPAGARDDDNVTEDQSAKWVEGDVDAMRSQKLEEIERYRKEAERKLRAESKVPGASTAAAAAGKPAAATSSGSTASGSTAARASRK